MYFQIKDFGVGFITYADRAAFAIIGLPLDLWLTDGSAAAQAWASRNNAVLIDTTTATAMLSALPPMKKAPI